MFNSMLSIGREEIDIMDIHFGKTETEVLGHHTVKEGMDTIGKITEVEQGLLIFWMVLIGRD